MQVRAHLKWKIVRIDCGLFNQPCTLALFARVWFWGVTWVIRISVISACISVVFCAIESYVEPLSYDTKNVWWGALLRNPFLECCQFAPAITRSILIVSLWFSMRWKALSVLFRMICDTFCLVLLSEIALRPPRLTTCAAPLVTSLLLPTIHDLSTTQTHRQVLFLSLSSFLKRKVSLSTGVPQERNRHHFQN